MVSAGKAKHSLEHQIHNSDNLTYLLKNSTLLAETVDFIYVDPFSTSTVGVRRSRKTDKQTLIAEFLESRFVAALPTLKPEGVIAVSVTDEFLPYLRILMDKVFGSANFIGMVVIDNGNVHNNARLLSVSHEYLLVYAKNLIHLSRSDIRWRQKREGLDVLRRKEQQLRKQHNTNYPLMTAELKSWLKDQPLPKRLKAFYNVDAKGVYSYSDLSAPGIKLTYDVIHPVTGKPVNLPSRGWGLSEDRFKQLIEQDQIIWGETEEQQPLKKLYLKDTPDQVIRGILHLPSRTPAQLLTKILGPNHGFSNPKPLEFLKYIIEVMTSDDAVILDFFAGSGTTGHAVLDLNYEHPESYRKFILVNNNEKQVFTKVLKPRIQAVITGKWADRQHRPRRAVLKVEG